MSDRSRLGRFACSLAIGLVAALGCKQPPDDDQRVPPPKIDDGEREALAIAAHREALERALPGVRAALIAGDPLAAWSLGFAPAAAPRLGPSRELEQAVEAAREAVGELDESRLPAADVAILRVMQFGLDRLHADVGALAAAHRDPMVSVRPIAATLDELRYRLLHADCDAGCEAVPGALAERLEHAQVQLWASSEPTAGHAAERVRALAADARALAAATLLDERPTLRGGLGRLADACEDHGAWLESIAGELDDTPSETLDWIATPASGPLARLPAIVGERALARRLAIEERIDLRPGPAFVEIERHVARWQRMATVLPGAAEPHADDVPTSVDLVRCEAALGRVRAGLESVDEVEPPRFDCGRYLGLLAGVPRSEAELILDILDLGVIEPQRRAVRARELPEIALVSGQWSPTVHTHLRRIMLLARLSEPSAASLAITRGTEALCWAEAALWIHGELGPPGEVGLTIGPTCAGIGDAEAVVARVTGDPRGALAGYGLSLIGDEPARMVGFDRFYWAPLGLMKLLATPKGIHPDAFSLPDDLPPTPAGPKPEIEFEEL